jgi:nitroreductase
MMVKTMLAEAAVKREAMPNAMEYRARDESLSNALGNLLRARRSVKYFDSDVSISSEDLSDIITAASYAPSAFNLQPWRVVQINSESVRMKLSDLAWRQPQILTASRLLLIAYDTYAWDRASFYQQFSDAELRKKVYTSVSSVYKNNPRLARDEAIRASSLYAMNILLAAQAKEYQSCALTGFDFGGVAKLLNLPGDWECCMLIALGKAAEENVIRPQQRQEHKYCSTTEQLTV